MLDAAIDASFKAIYIQADDILLSDPDTHHVATGVVYTTFHHPLTQANVITTDYSDWATNCPEYKVTAVQVAPASGPTRYQQEYQAFATKSREVAPARASRGGKRPCVSRSW